MDNRKGEKIGWTGGWIGGFLWMGILSAVFLFQGKYVQGLLGLVLTAAAVAGVIFFSPWRFPSTRYWKLMLVPYGMLFLSICWAIWSFGGLEAAGLSWWNLFSLLPLFTPLGILGNRKWQG